MLQYKTLLSLDPVLTTGINSSVEPKTHKPEVPNCKHEFGNALSWLDYVLRNNFVRRWLVWMERLWLRLGHSKVTVSKRFGLEVKKKPDPRALSA